MPELIVENLNVSFPTWHGDVTVVDQVGFTMGTERLGIVGESGSGKSMTARALLGLIRPPGKVRADRMVFDGIDLTKLDAKGWRAIRGQRIGMILQDPKYSLNPVQRVEDQIAEVAMLHDRLGRKEVRERVLAMLAEVGIEDPQRVAASYPHQLSGGLGQRVMIVAMLINSPDLLIADEPTSALDVMVRGQVLQLMDREIQRRGMGLILISHDLNTVARYCDRVLIMYRGKVVETCQADRLFEARHPYTRGLLACLPSAGTRGQKLAVLDRAAIESEAC
ncbi:MAG TPA: ABC transporter ATP-binding protein [Holophaga sp.]|nr:ABC transporter ATP-binding protein [Holophaga sp.]